MVIYNGNIKECWGEDHQFLLLTQDYFLTQYVWEPTSSTNQVGMCDLSLSSQYELVDNVKIH